MFNTAKLAVRAMSQKLYNWLDTIQQERGNPVNYRSLEISSNALRYVDLSGQIHIAPFENMVKVEFIREEALFPCFDGPYLETKWIICLIKNMRIEVMDEAPHRKKLLAAFSSCLHGFDLSVASVGLHSDEAGRWLCYQPSNPHAASAQH